LPAGIYRSAFSGTNGHLYGINAHCIALFQAYTGHKHSPLATANPASTYKIKEDRMKFRPLHDRVVVKRIDAEEKSAGGIIIPDSAKEKPSQGEITAVGPGGRDEAGKLIPIDLTVGDRVLFGNPAVT